MIASKTTCGMQLQIGEIKSNPIRLYARRHMVFDVGAKWENKPHNAPVTYVCIQTDQSYWKKDKY